jgi:hypothetical protein
VFKSILVVERNINTWGVTHMLRALMLYGISGEVDCADVVEVDEGGALEGTV